MSNAGEGRRKTEEKSVPPDCLDLRAKVELDIEGVSRDITEVSGWIRQAQARYDAIQDKLANPSTEEQRQRYESALAQANDQLVLHGKRLEGLYETRSALEATRRTLLPASGT